MTEDKHNRIMAAITVNAVLLIVILAAIVIYQLVVVSTLRNTRDGLLAEIEQVQQETEDLEKDLNERLKSDWYLEELLAKYLMNNGN